MAESLQRGKYRKLETAIIATTLCFALLPILVAGLVIPPRFSDLYHQKAVREVEHVARSKGRTIDVFLGERTAQLRSLAEMFTFEELTAPGQLPRILRAIKTGSRSYVDLGIIDMDGRHVAYAGAYDISEVNYQNELWFAEVKRTGVFISDVFMGFRNFPHIIIAVMREEEGRFWILRATIDSAVFTSIVQDSRLSAGGDAFVLNADGHLQTESLLAGHVMTPVSVPWPRQGASISEERLNGKDLLLAKVPLSNAPWMLVVAEDPAEHLSLLFRSRSLIGGIGGVGFLLLFGGAWVTTRFMTRRLVAADRKKAAQDAAALQSRKMTALGKLAAGIAHEINNPLMLIREHAGWIRDLLEDENSAHMQHHGEIQNAAIKVEEHVDRAKDVTHRLVGFARRIDPSPESMPLNPIVDQAVAFLHNEASFRGIIIECDFAAGDPRVSTDVGQFQQVVLNILDNAIDAAAKGGGRVWVVTQVDAEAENALVLIHDNGPGIPDAQLDHIFEPFFTTKDAGENTGLGLSVCYSIMEGLGGSIRASNHPDGGAEFTVILPLNGHR